MRWRDKPREEQKADLGRYRAARRAAETGTRKFGLRDESPTSNELNSLVIEAAEDEGGLVLDVGDGREGEGEDGELPAHEGIGAQAGLRGWAREVRALRVAETGEETGMDVPDPLPLRSIPVPAEVTAVTGCTCGGLQWHRAQTIYDPPGSGCAIWEQPHEQAQAAVDAALDREREWGAALNAKLRAALA